ncbi:MAG: MarR family winged helix-turn-helix transcriptional regulator [Nocardioidaceae bacterium]
MTAANTKAVWLSTPQQRAWRAYISGSTLLFDRLDRDLREQYDLSLPEYEILVRLSEARNRSLRMAELASSMAHSRSRVTHTIGRMQDKGLVERRACPTDRRGVIASLTDQGWNALVEAAPMHVRGVREHLVDIADPDDLAAVGRVFAQVGDRLAEQ